MRCVVFVPFVDERFTADAAAEDAYRHAALREALGKPPAMTVPLVRAGTVLEDCLTSAEEAAVQGAA